MLGHCAYSITEDTSLGYYTTDRIQIALELDVTIRDLYQTKFIYGEGNKCSSLGSKYDDTKFYESYPMGVTQTFDTTYFYLNFDASV